MYALYSQERKGTPVLLRFSVIYRTVVIGHFMYSRSVRQIGLQERIPIPDRHRVEKDLHRKAAFFAAPATPSPDGWLPLAPFCCLGFVAYRYRKTRREAGGKRRLVLGKKRPVTLLNQQTEWVV